ncbi:hypothetical protein GRF29_106g216345 [Pseudopithomyces chartarum]|uniref:Uncharacterized protein n=1 Tax=Pseudopithomyces chartarum TaxID=1892770 RepID=A0AAN6RFQ6_9PLEO|nr:hypothetical protein GRF29_106g216345 [Pseudopithomyces chartarum]
MLSEQRYSHASKDYTIDHLDHTSSSADIPPEVDDSIAEDYRVYMLAASTPAADNTNGPPSSDAGFMSLSGDSRLRTGASEMKHSEDVANRNIDQYGSTTSSHSRGSSLKGQLQQMNQAAQGRQGMNNLNSSKPRRMSVAASIVSLGSPHSIGESPASSLHKYTLGTGVATGGGLIDGILPHVEDPQALSSDRKKWPSRQARDESTLISQRRRPANDDSSSEIIQEQPGRRNAKKNHGAIDLHQAIREGPDDYRNQLRADLDGIVDLTDTEDVDKETRWAPGQLYLLHPVPLPPNTPPEVTHETIKPHSHEIIQERIYREIHNHDIYHYIQPVYQTEILPARHFVHNAQGDLVEVPADKLPECTGANQRWSLVRGDREKPNKHAAVVSLHNTFDSARSTSE